MEHGKVAVIMNATERTKIQIWETPNRPNPRPEGLLLLDGKAPDLPSLFARAVIDGAKGIDIYPAAYDGHCGETFFS